MRRVAGHHRSARSMRADAVLDAVGLSRDDAHPPVIDTERLSAYLRHRGDKALTDSGAAGHQFDRAGRVDGDSRAVHRAEPAFLDKDRDAASDQLAGITAAPQLGLQRLPADMREGLVEQ